MTIAISSQKSGTGKTSTSISLAVGLARKGKRTLLVDIDSQANSSKVLLAAPAARAVSFPVPSPLPEQAGCLQRPVKATPLRGGLQPALTGHLRQQELFLGGEGKKMLCAYRGQDWLSTQNEGLRQERLTNDSGKCTWRAAAA